MNLRGGEEERNRRAKKERRKSSGEEGTGRVIRREEEQRMRGNVVLGDVGFGNLSHRPSFQLLKPNAIYCYVAQEHMALYRA